MVGNQSAPSRVLSICASRAAAPTTGASRSLQRDDVAIWRSRVRTHSVSSVPGRRKSRTPSAGILLALFGGLALLAGCGASGGASYSSTLPSSNHSAAGAASSGATAYGPSGTTNQPQTAQPTSQYLIKSLSVSMAMPDTRSTATELQTWIANADPRAQSAGANYSQDGDAYDVTLRFTVQASEYDQIEAYLRDYAGQHKGKLINLQETVQDVTNDYIDTQTQLSNLQAEEKRLETLMGQAQSLNDLLTIEQRISDVRGQIQQINAHLSQLSGQTTFYSVQIQLTPLSTYVPPTPIAWDPGGVFHDALASAKGFGEGLLTLLIWLAVYAVYIIPLGVIVWLVMRYRRQRAARLAGPASHVAPPPA